METYEVMKALLFLIEMQVDCVTMRLPVASIIESPHTHNTIELQLKEGSAFSIHIERLKNGVRV